MDGLRRRDMERFVAERCAALVARPPSKTVPDDVIGRHETSSGLHLTDGQRAAIRMVSEQRLSLLLGGAGVGKTATLAAIVAMARDTDGPSIRSLSPAAPRSVCARQRIILPGRLRDGWAGSSGKS